MPAHYRTDEKLDDWLIMTRCSCGFRACGVAADVENHFEKHLSAQYNGGDPMIPVGKNEVEPSKLPDTKPGDRIRPTDPQPSPVKTDHPGVWALVIADMKARDDFGRKKYGTPLQSNNGRDALVDLYQELLDACVYVRQEIEERKDTWTVAMTEAARMADEEGRAAGCMGCTSTAKLARLYREAAARGGPAF